MKRPRRWQNPFAMTISEEKSQLRRILLKQRTQEDFASGQEIGRRIAVSLLDSDLFRSAKTVFTYCSTKEEIDTYLLMRACTEAGKTLCVPRCETEPGVMTARLIHTPDALFPGKYGIMEPSADAKTVDPGAIDLCVVPCLAADSGGYRLGYGGGYYDRFLIRCRGNTVALCADARILPRVPHDVFDIPCDYIFTERRILIREKK